MFTSKNKEVTAFGLSHVGRVRARNEDGMYLDAHGRFALLADGMGGHKGGQQASQMCLEEMRVRLEHLHAPQAETGEPLSLDEEELQSTLRRFIKETSLAVARRGAKDPNLHQMGTTLVVWTLVDNQVWLAHAGDSRAYLVRNKQIFQLTVDHCLENEQIRLGMPRDQAEKSPMRHVLLRNVGLYPPSEPSVASLPRVSGDLWLLCSDGLSNKVGMAQLLETVLQKKTFLPHLCQSLVEQAYANGGEDNISVIAIAT